MATDTNTKRPGTANDASVPGSTTSENLLKKNPVVQYPTEGQDINSILEPYINQLSQLGPEYQKEMNYLAPYLSGSVTDSNLDPAPAYTGPDAKAVNAGQNDLAQADSQLGSAVEAEKPPGFGSLATAAKQYEKTILPTAGLTSAEAEQKYLETYEGQPADTSGWSQEQKDAYAAVLGNSVTSSGLPTVATTQGLSTATQNANTVQQQITASSQASTAGGGNIQ